MEEVALKRLRLRSWRRGMREMDLILGRFADSELARLSQDEQARYEALLSENDQDIYSWISGGDVPPSPLAEMVGRLRAFHAVE